ncbi:MAG: hypothetical protein LUQ53_04240, partial [Methanothrix sp.]|nr:hypothetical protein [Methanothrix sp.]
EFISRLDDARHGRRVSEDSIPAPVAPAPSHAPTSGKDATTKGQGKSEDEGETVKKAYKQPSGSIPAPVAAAPSHAPTSGKDYTTKGDGKSDDEGEKISKEAMKETLRQLIDGDEDDVAALLSEGGHKAGCTCGFCTRMKQNKEGKGKSDKSKDDAPEKDVKESFGGGMAAAAGRVPVRPPMRRRLGNEGRMNSRQQYNKVPPKACGVPSKAAINPMQPSMEHLDVDGSIQALADRLLEAPGAE